MSEPTSVPRPREVFDRVQRLILDRRLDEYADLFAEDATFEAPFAPAGVPRRLEGRETIRAFIRAGSERVQSATGGWEFHSVVVHETADPEVIVTEFDVHGELTATGEPYRFANLQVMRVRNGEIASLRDYWSPLDRLELAALAEPAR